MSYKTILAHLHASNRAPAILDAVRRIAEPHQAHVIGLHASLADVIDSIGLDPKTAAEMLKHYRQARQEEAEEIKTAFESAMASLKGVTHEWRCTTSRYLDGLFDEVVNQGRRADLVIADGRPHTDPLSAWSDMPVRLIMECGRPVLLVPPAGIGAKLGERVLVAWNGARESARAAFDALPFLRQAAQATVLTIFSGNDEDDALSASAMDLAQTLKRHGVKAEARSAQRGEKSDAECIAESIAIEGCDTLVMGCYSHSRFREMIFGGVTRHILNNMPTPVLVSH